MLTPLPNDSGEPFKTCGLKGVVGEPNECLGRLIFPRLEPGAGVVASGREFFLDGVSGMFTLLKRDEDDNSALRLRFDISPVDMKAAGNGLAILYASGVSNESDDPWLASVAVSSLGRRAPMGSDLEKPESGLVAVSKSFGGGCIGGGCMVSSSVMLELEEEGVRVCDKGWGFGAD